MTTATLDRPATAAAAALPYEEIQAVLFAEARALDDRD